MQNNLYNFKYETSLLESLWLNHFIDFCFLLSTEDIFYLIIIFYILSISVVNCFFWFNKNLLKKIFFPFKAIFDFGLIYIFLRSLFVINLFYLSDFLNDISNIFGFLTFYFWCLILICILIVSPFILIKISNKLI
jgi:hypothetical protein